MIMKFVPHSILAILALVYLEVHSANVVSSIQDDLAYDENERLTTHYMLYPGDDSSCPAVTFPGRYGFEYRPLLGQALETVFPSYEAGSGACPVACVERGTDRAIAHAVMPHKVNLDSTDNLGTWFTDNCERVEVCVMNYHSRTDPMHLYWIDFQRKEILTTELGFGVAKSTCFNSYIGHQFIARDGGTQQAIGGFKVEYITTIAFGESPPSGYSDETTNFDEEIKITLKDEWRKHLRMKRTFSPLGFKKSKLPDDVYANMGSFYYNNRHFKVREEWGGKGVFVNWWESDCFMIIIPWGSKGIWQKRLMDLVEVWAGVPIEETSMYGLRQYASGARLLTHVDRESTHAVSLIVNIAQGNMTEPWPVEVFDHADRLHEIIMEPGDIVYYESAKSLHSRNRPLSGENAYYVNLFTHYRPVGDDYWYNKPNPTGTPEPLLEVEGQCKLNQVGTTEVLKNQLGVVQAVQCDDERLGVSLSPTRFRATSGNDLIKWWRYTGKGRDTSKVTTSDLK